MIFPKRDAFQPRSNDTSEINWLGTSFLTGFSPRQFLTYRSLLDTFDDKDFTEHATVRPVINFTPQGARANRRNQSTPSTPETPSELSTIFIREIARLAEYHQLRESHKAICRIMKGIQDKRREEFRVLRKALYQIYHYNGPHLQKPGEKAVAASLIRKGGLGTKFVDSFDDKAKWKWLQLWVTAL
ncbi:hypothetical protein DFH28DRAFT_1129482 [Melampsora americana]|nr:hypothetical protein DFH28DRAFT_1129482 [Melampsora americana]